MVEIKNQEKPVIELKGLSSAVESPMMKELGTSVDGTVTITNAMAK